MATATIPAENQAAPLERLDNGIYKKGKLVVCPVASDKLLAHAYLRFEAEGILPKIFYEGVPSLSWFLETYLKMTVLGCFEESSGRMDLRGLGWINSLTVMGGERRRGDCGMAFLPETKKEKLVFGRMMLSYAFRELDLDALFGTTPEPNRTALIYSRLLGFRLIGPIPNFCTWQEKLCSGWVSAMTRDDWAEKVEVKLEWA